MRHLHSRSDVFPGFYVTEEILKEDPTVSIDILERLPTPFGLVRFGVAPDHPEVKAVEEKFADIAQHPNVSYFGNVTVGKDVTVAELKQFYDAVVLACGCQQDHCLEIPAENAHGVYSARRALLLHPQTCRSTAEQPIVGKLREL